MTKFKLENLKPAKSNGPAGTSALGAALMDFLFGEELSDLEIK